MGNQIKKYSSISNAHQKGFIRINSNLESSLQENEIYGYHLSSEPEEREYYLKCPFCNRIIFDNGINEFIECENCKKIIEIPDNNFNEIKKQFLYSKSNQKKCLIYINTKNCLNTIYRLLPFKKITQLKTPSFKTINLIVNKDKIPNMNNYNENNIFIDLINNIIIPFFQFKSRLLHKGKIFSIGEYEFKVISTTPNLISGKITSLTLIRCHEFYSNIIPIKEVNIITCKKYDNLNIEDIKNKIYNTPYLSQLCILNNYLTRINSIDLFIRKCSPNFGIINNETILNIENKNIEDLNSVFFGVVKNENPFLNDRKNQNIIIERFYKPYFLSGIKKYIERGDIIKIGEIKLFVLKCNPENGFISKNTKNIFKFGKSEEELKERLNNDIEFERHRVIRNNNFDNNEINTSLNNNRIRIRFSNRNIQERIRLLNELFLTSNLFLFNQNEFIQQQKIESIIRGLPKFKIDKKYLNNLEKFGEEYAKKCVICMENYKEDDEVETLPCFHIFHKICIEEWFNNNNNNCPICKNEITNEGDLIN